MQTPVKEYNTQETMNFPHSLFLSFPGMQPDYLAEIESLRSEKKQECKSQTPSSCEPVGDNFQL